MTVQGRCIQEQDAGKIFRGLFGIRIDDSYAGGFSFSFIVNNGMDHGKWPDSKVTCFLRPGQGRRYGTEVSAERTAAHTQIPRLALGPSLLQMNIPGLRQLRPASLYHEAVLIFCLDFLLQILLHAVECKGRKVFPVRHGFQPIPVSADPCEYLHPRIPGGYVLFYDSPFFSEPIIYGHLYLLAYPSR